MDKSIGMPWGPVLVGGQWYKISCGVCGDNCSCGWGTSSLQVGPGLHWPIPVILDSSGRYSPTDPSTNSLTTSRCPTWRAYSCSRWARIQPSVGGSVENRPPSLARSIGSALLTTVCAVGSLTQPLGQHVKGVIGLVEPALGVWIVVGPRVGHLFGFEAPLHPAPLDEDQVFEESKWRPARRQDACSQLVFAQTLELREAGGPVVAQLLQQTFPRILK